MKRLRVPLLLTLLLPLLFACSAQSTREENASNLVRINVDLGKAYIQDGNYSQAMVKLQRALSADSNYAPAHSTIAVLYWRLGNYEKAEEHFHEALRLSPDDPLAHNSYGVFLCERKRIKESEQQFRKAYSNPLYDRPEVAYSNAGMCALREHKLDKAEKYFRAALRRNPRFAPALLRMAELSYQRQQYLPARAYFERYTEVGPETAASLWLGIRVENKLGDHNTASSYALRLKAKFPDSDETRRLLDMQSHE